MNRFWICDFGFAIWPGTPGLRVSRTRRDYGLPIGAPTNAGRTIGVHRPERIDAGPRVRPRLRDGWTDSGVYRQRSRAGRFRQQGGNRLEACRTPGDRQDACPTRPTEPGPGCVRRAQRIDQLPFGLRIADCGLEGRGGRRGPMGGMGLRP